MGFIAWIVIGIVAGWLAEQIMKTDMGLLMNLGVGIAGALIGGFLMGLVGLSGPDDGFIWSIVVATLGAVLLLFVVNKVKGSKVA